MFVRPDQLLGAHCLPGRRCRFLVWAPRAQQAELELTSPYARRLRMEQLADGYFAATVDEIGPGARYFYRLDGGRPLPDPASRLQPLGVHGPSEVVDLSYPWRDQQWQGLPLSKHVLYELHVGTFSPAGDFDGVVSQLDRLAELGITTLELMPVGQCPGARNWGYDGAAIFAVQFNYGGPRGLQRLVDECHARGLAVVLDAVYNHFGPEGAYLNEFGHYFTGRYATPWGAAVNFDGRGSDEVRRFFIQNALMWIVDFHIDGLRLDAVHAIFDVSARPFLRELRTEVHDEARRLGRQVLLIAESNQNDPRLTAPVERSGLGLDAQWNDDFHRGLHALLTGESDGYYADFGGVQRLAKALAEGFVYTGQYSSYRGRRHGAPSGEVPPERFVVYSQNHDQIGNRAVGERLAALIPFPAVKLAATVVLLSANLPMLFMGEEYAETAPFLYFVDHSDPELIEAVRRGRRQEYSSFEWRHDPPDPQAETTFLRSKLQPQLLDEPRHRAVMQYYKTLLKLRRDVPALARLDKRQMKLQHSELEQSICMRRWEGASQAAFIGHFGPTRCSWRVRLPPGRWRRTLDSSDEAWYGPGSRLPACLDSDGEVLLALDPWQAIVLTLEEPDDQPGGPT